MRKKDILIWMSLVVFTLTTMFVSEQQLPSYLIVFGVMTIASIKFLSIGLTYMELYQAHRFWQIVFVGLILLFDVIVISLS